MQFTKTILKICLVFLCLLPFRAGGLPQSDGAIFFMEIQLQRDPITGDIIPEIWKDVVDHENIYQASNYGRIRSLDYQGKSRLIPLILSPNENGFGYLKLTLYKNHKKFTHYVHRLVIEAFCGSSDFVIDHIDGNRRNNCLWNLRFCTSRENVSFENVKHKKPKTSKYTGVHWDAHHNKWRASAYVNKIPTRLGRFDSEDEAHEAYLKAIQR